MKSRTEFLKEQAHGTYVGVRFNDMTKDDIIEYIEETQIPNPIEVDKLHTTLIYSKKFLPNFIPTGFLPEIIHGEFRKFEAWDTQDGKRALVMSYNAPELVVRNKEITDKHGATSDYDSYKVHLTLSYDIGDYDISYLQNYTGVIQIIEEYYQPLDLDWVQS